MRGGCIGGINIAPCSQTLMECSGDLGLRFFCQVIPETDVAGIFDHILNNPFPSIVGKCHPIDLYLSIASKKSVGLWLPDDEYV